MTRKTYTAEYKTKLVPEVVREESRLEEIAAAKRAEQKKEAALEKEKTKMLKKIDPVNLIV